MAEWKGTVITFLQEKVRSCPEGVEKKFLEDLTPAEKALYQQTVAFQWVPIEAALALWEKAVPAVYPNDSDGTLKMGKELAINNLRGMYSILVKVATVPMVMKQAAKLWATYHRKGEASALPGATPKDATFIVEGYPDLPAKFRKILCGYITGVLDLTGAKNVTYRHNDRNPDHWEWTFHWD